MQAFEYERAVALDEDPDLDRGPRRAIMVMVTLVFLFLGMGVLWMTIAALDISVNASGKVIPSSRVQEIQSLEGGIVREIVVREGQTVTQGDLLVRLESLQFDAELGEVRQRYWGYLTSMTRLDAELSQQPPVFSEAMRTQAPDLVKEQRHLWESRMAERQATINGARGDIAQRQQELVEAKAKVESTTRNLKLANERFQFLLHKRADAVEFLNAQKEVSQLEGDLNSLRLSIPRLKTAIGQVKSKLEEVLSRYRTEASKERSELEIQAASLAQVLTGHEDKVNRQAIHAPMDAVVNRLLMSTVGGVAKPGESILELTPLDDRLLVTVEVQPKDIAFVKIGQTAQVRISAYDSSIFGMIPGSVVRVGADTIVDEREDRTFFEVQIETEQAFIHAKGQDFAITPGMTADVSILTGERTLLEYMLKPIFKTFDTALQER